MPKAAAITGRRCLFGVALVGGYHTGRSDELIGIGGGDEVEELLGRLAQLLTILGHQDEGTLHHIAAVLMVASLAATPSTVMALTLSLSATADTEA